MCRSAGVSCQDSHCTCSWTFEERRQMDRNGAHGLPSMVEISLSKLHLVRASTSFSRLIAFPHLVLRCCPGSTQCLQFFLALLLITRVPSNKTTVIRLAERTITLYSNQGLTNNFTNGYVPCKSRVGYGTCCNTPNTTCLANGHCIGGSGSKDRGA